MLAVGCGQLRSADQECAGNACSEKDINSPIENSTPTNKPKQEKPNVQDLHFPQYSSAWGLPKPIYERSVQKYENAKFILDNPRYVTVIDIGQHSSQRRWFLFDLVEQTVEMHLTSHGVNSDKDNDGYATDFSNTQDSRQTSLGMYVTLDTYIGKNGYSLRLRGKESTNSNAEERAIVVHPAAYVNEKNGKAGRSWGCPALDPEIAMKVIDKIRDGSLLFIDKE